MKGGLPGAIFVLQQAAHGNQLLLEGALPGGAVGSLVGEKHPGVPEQEGAEPAALGVGLVNEAAFHDANEEILSQIRCIADAVSRAAHEREDRPPVSSDEIIEGGHVVLGRQVFTRVDERPGCRGQAGRRIFI